jgi:hypothetical protein
MEPRFGHDFSQVRVHTDSKAAESARDLTANAYTVGRNIVFGTGQFLPGTQMGWQLLAHELTHVVQQSAGIAQRIQRQPVVDAGQPVKTVQPTIADIDKDLQTNQLGEEGAREIVARGFGGESGLSDLFQGMPAAKTQVDAHAAVDKAKLKKYLESIDWAKELSRSITRSFL